MANIKLKLICSGLLLFLSACSSDIRTLDNLGSTDDFNNQEILPDFEAPEDETEAQKNSCTGFVNTNSSRLNARVDANINATICGKLESKSTIMISLQGHKNGFLRIITPECDQEFAYASERFIGLGSDCNFNGDNENVVERPSPAPEPQPTPPSTIDRTPDSFVNTFYIERREFSLANGKAWRWDGCKNGFKSTGGYNSDSRCGRAFLHSKFSDNLNEQFYKCVFEAADLAGYPKTEKVFINHLGTYNDRNARNSTRKSNHAFARAMDIKNFNLVDDRGQVSRVSTLLRNYTGRQAVFYDEFRDCWKRSMPSSCRAGNTEYNGSIGHRSSKLGGNTLHNDHIHLSFPQCAG
jgi:hypothetical protein